MKRHSLLFGVQAYPGTGNLPALKAPNADVDGLLEVVSDARYMGEVGKVRWHKDLPHPEARRAFFDFFKDIDPQDVVLIYFSGHGLRDDAGDLYLCFTDADENALDVTAQRVTEIRDWLANRRFRRTLVVLDCCYSGAAGAQLTRDSITTQLAAIEKAREDGTGLFVLSSSGAAETSKEVGGRGVFTHHFIEGIQSGAADMNADGDISVSEIAEYLQRKVPEDAVGQLPQLNAHRVTGTFTVARNPVALAAEAARRAAELAAVRAAERAVLAEGAMAKLKEHVAFGSISLAFAGQVQAWLETHPADGTAHPRLGLLQGFSEGRLSAVDFHERWRDAADLPRRRPSRRRRPSGAKPPRRRRRRRASRPGRRSRRRCLSRSRKRMMPVSARPKAPKVEPVPPPKPAEAPVGWRRILGRIGLVILAYFGILVVAAGNDSVPLLVVGWMGLTGYWVYRLVRRK